MISPQLHPDSSTSCPPRAPDGPFDVSLEKQRPPAKEPRLLVVMGANMESQKTTEAVVNGLWHCLLGSLAAGLAVSAVLGVLVLVLGLIG